MKLGRPGLFLDTPPVSKLVGNECKLLWSRVSHVKRGTLLRTVISVWVGSRRLADRRCERWCDTRESRTDVSTYNPGGPRDPYCPGWSSWEVVVKKERETNPARPRLHHLPTPTWETQSGHHGILKTPHCPLFVSISPRGSDFVNTWSLISLMDFSSSFHLRTSTHCPFDPSLVLLPVFSFTSLHGGCLGGQRWDT